VAPSGQHANLQPTPDRRPYQYSPIQFFTSQPNNSVKALKADQYNKGLNNRHIYT